MTMIEKMALAMAVADSGPEGSGLFNIHWTEFREGYKSSARAALEALLEPNEAMVEAGECGPYPNDEEHPGFGDPMPRQIYKAMIQAALEKK